MRRALRDVTTGLTILCGHEAPGGRFGGASDSDKDRIRATRETMASCVVSGMNERQNGRSF